MNSRPAQPEDLKVCLADQVPQAQTVFMALSLRSPLRETRYNSVSSAFGSSLYPEGKPQKSGKNHNCYTPQDPSYHNIHSFSFELLSRVLTEHKMLLVSYFSQIVIFITSTADFSSKPPKRAEQWCPVV